jgi:hypothetical protein
MGAQRPCWPRPGSTTLTGINHTEGHESRQEVVAAMRAAGERGPRVDVAELDLNPVIATSEGRLCRGRPHQGQPGTAERPIPATGSVRPGPPRVKESEK